MTPGDRLDGGGTLYTRPGCPLCYLLRRSALRAARRHGVALREINIDADPHLLALYGEQVPVLLLPGEEPIRGRAPAADVEVAFRRAAARRLPR